MKAAHRGGVLKPSLLIIGKNQPVSACLGGDGEVRAILPRQVSERAVALRISNERLEVESAGRFVRYVSVAFSQARAALMPLLLHLKTLESPASPCVRIGTKRIYAPSSLRLYPLLLASLQRSYKEGQSCLSLIGEEP